MPPKEVFQLPLNETPVGSAPYDTIDGQKFLVLVPVAPANRPASYRQLARPSEVMQMNDLRALADKVVDEPTPREFIIAVTEEWEDERERRWLHLSAPLQSWRPLV